MVGDKCAADAVLREAIIAKINEDAEDGINIFVTDDEPTVKMKNIPCVEVAP